MGSRNATGKRMEEEAERVRKKKDTSAVNDQNQIFQHKIGSGLYIRNEQNDWVLGVHAGLSYDLFQTLAPCLLR
jgi:hypothetical protein